jgi:hypothetical protein
VSATPGRTFTCAYCGGEFDKGWSHEEALAELKENFGDIPVEECAEVCDDCWELVRPRGELPVRADEPEDTLSFQATVPISDDALLAVLDDPEAFEAWVLHNLIAALESPRL